MDFNVYVPRAQGNERMEGSRGKVIWAHIDNCSVSECECSVAECESRVREPVKHPLHFHSGVFS